MLEEISANRIFGGWQKRFRHHSVTLGCDMVFSLFLPPQSQQAPVPVFYWLSGLTCDDQNFVTKAGAQRYAAEAGIAIVTPDTSPRGPEVADDDQWDLGQGAGFYLNATQSPWQRHYQMQDYIVDELPGLINQSQPVDATRWGISGHSMGGHGALTIALKYPGRFRSVSAFAPICAPTLCPWGEKAFSHYLGDDRQVWQAHDACQLIATAQERLPLLIDQGDADNFLNEQLQPQRLVDACQQHQHPIQLRMQPGYDHSYYFISTFIGDHIAHHRAAMN